MAEAPCRWRRHLAAERYGDKLILKYSELFWDALSDVAAFEGGYVNDPVDSGGETFRGISRKNWRGWPGWDLIDVVKDSGCTSAHEINVAFENHEIMEGLVVDFYYVNFWKPVFEQERLQIKFFDTGVNCGRHRAAKILQAAINEVSSTALLKVDGALGPLTLSALQGIDEVLLLTSFVERQKDFYRSIVARKPCQERFIRGWLRRAAWLPN